MNGRRLALIVALAMIGGLLFFRNEGLVVQVTFEMDATGTEGAFAFAMPVQGKACLVQDLNMRNDPVPTVAREFADVENRHRIVLLDKAGRAVRFLDVASHLEADSNQPVGTRSYCKDKSQGEPISLRLVWDTATSGWWMTMN